MDTPAFDPSKPFETVSAAPAFDPSKPFEEVKRDRVSDVVSSVSDFVKSLPYGFAKNLTSQSPYAAESPVPPPELPPAAKPEAIFPGIHKPEGVAGELGSAVGSALTNPISYVGPGSAALKIGGAVAGALGSEGAGQATKGTPYEGPARLAGGLVGGVAAAKTLGPKAIEAAVPTSEELRAAKDTGYQAARNADLVLHPQGPATWAAKTEQELTNGPRYAFTAGENGTAPKTLAALADAQAIPTAGNPVITGANLDSIRIRLGTIAGETRDFKPTPDAKAAMVAKRSLAKYTENIPQDHVLAGDAQSYGAETARANANNAAFERTRGVEQKLTNATDATEGSIAAKPDNQIKSKLRSGYLTNPKKQRGLIDEEVQAIRDTNRGSLTENALRQFGRLAPEGPMNMALHVGTGLGAAAATGGMSVPIQIAGALLASGAKHAAQAITRNKAAAVVKMMAMRSPEYERRAKLAELYNQLTVDKSANPAQILRSALVAVQ